MWNYNYTDTMYIGNDINNKNATIIHSDIYLGKDYSDGIRHFKYIKREMVNGKWKYYYKDDNLAREKQRRDEVYDHFNTATGLRKSYIAKNGNRIYSDDAMMKKIDRIHEKANRDAVASDMSYTLAKNRSDRRKAKYEKYLINPLNRASDTISKGKTRLSNLFNKIKSKIKRR